MTLSHITTLARRLYSTLNKARIAGALAQGKTHPLYRYFEHRVANTLVDRALRKRR